MPRRLAVDLLTIAAWGAVVLGAAVVVPTLNGTTCLGIAGSCAGWKEAYDSAHRPPSPLLDINRPESWLAAFFIGSAVILLVLRARRSRAGGRS